MEDVALIRLKGKLTPGPLLIVRVLLFRLIKKRVVVVAQTQFLNLLSDCQVDISSLVGTSPMQHKTRAIVARPNKYSHCAVLAIVFDRTFLRKQSLDWLGISIDMSVRQKIKRKPSLLAIALKFRAFVYSVVDKYGKLSAKRSKLQAKAKECHGPSGEDGKKYFLNESWSRMPGLHIEDVPIEVAEIVLTEQIGLTFPGPKGIHLAVLNRCNLSCVMCPYHSPNFKSHQTSKYFDKTRQMTEETFSRVLEAAIEFGSSIQFGQIEEALIHPSAIAWMARAKQSGVHVHLTTNGTLLKGEKLIALARAEIDSLMLSLDATSPEMYRQIRGEDLLLVERNLHNFLEYVKEHDLKKPKLWVSFILQDISLKERDEFLKKWESLGVDRVTYYELSDIDPKTGRIKRSGFNYKREHRYTCASPWDQCVIYPEGEVSLCCQSMLETGWRGVVSMGDLKESSLKEIWQGHQYNKLRKRLLQNKLMPDEICFGCDLWSSSSYFVEESELFTRIYNETSETFEIKRRLNKTK